MTQTHLLLLSLVKQWEVRREVRRDVGEDNTGGQLAQVIQGPGARKMGFVSRGRAPERTLSWKGKEQETAPLQVHAGGGSSSR